MTKKVGLSLSSGGARGLAHIGVIKTLRKHNIPIDCISGTSMGALVGAYYALHAEIELLEKMALGFKKKRDVLRIVDLNNPKKSIVKGNKVRRFLSKYYGNKTFRDTKIPLSIGTTNINTAEQVILTSGKLITAALASATIPGIFPPIKHRNRYLVDGGLVDFAPVGLVKKMGAEVIISVEISTTKYPKMEKYDTMSILERVYEIFMSNTLKLEDREYTKNIIVLRPQTGSRFNMFSFYNSEKYIRAGEIEAEKYIKKIKRMIK